MKPNLDECIALEYKNKTSPKDSKCFVDFISPSSNLSILFTSDEKGIFVEGKYNNQTDLLFDATGPIKLSIFKSIISRGTNDHIYEICQWSRGHKRVQESAFWAVVLFVISMVLLGISIIVFFLVRKQFKSSDLTEKLTNENLVV